MSRIADKTKRTLMRNADSEDLKTIQEEDKNLGDIFNPRHKNSHRLGIPQGNTEGP
jgi:hypothetical protein